jgi:hypothetical protein
MHPDMSKLDQQIRQMYRRHFEHIRRCAAREVWRKRHQPTPSGRQTWEEWWTEKFGQGETFVQYTSRLIRERADDNAIPAKD